MKRFIAIVFLCSELLSCVTAEGLNFFPRPKVEASEQVAFEKLLKTESDLQSGIDYAIKGILPTVLRFGVFDEISPQCAGSLLKTVVALREMKLWAFQMIDASGKPGGGILSGRTTAYGSYDQCLRVIIPGGQHTGQYCKVALNPPLPPRVNPIPIYKNVFPTINATFKTELMNMLKEKLYALYLAPFKLGICLPSSCSAEDFSKILTIVSVQMGFHVEYFSCEVQENFTLDTLQIVILTIFVTFIVVCIVASITMGILTILSLKKEKTQNNFAIQIMESFSIVANFRKLMKISPVKNRSLDSTNGIKFMSSTWIVLCHTYFVSNISAYKEVLNIETILGSVSFASIMASFLGVDSFFSTSAALIAYNTVKQYDNLGMYNPVFSVLRRIWRLLPALFLAMGFYFLLPLMGSGPEFKTNIVEYAAGTCRTNWWTNLIFSSNFVRVDKMCMGHSWYVAADMQCFLVATIYFLFLFKNKRWGNVFLGIVILASVFSSGAVTYIKEYPPTAILKASDPALILEYFSNAYLSPHIHLGAYGVGLYLGTYIARNQNVKLSIVSTMIGWFMATGAGLAVVFAIYPWNNYVAYSTVEAVVFSATQRTVWGGCVVWVVFACYARKGGYVNSFLSWPGFQPLMQTSYLLYLIHLPVHLLYNFSGSNASDMNNLNMVYIFFGTLCISQLLAVFFRIFFEAPLFELEKLFRSWYNERCQGTEQNDITKDLSQSKMHSPCTKAVVENITCSTRI